MKRVQSHAVIGIIVLSLLIGYVVGTSIYPEDWVGVLHAMLSSFCVGSFIAIAVGSWMQFMMPIWEARAEDDLYSATDEA